MSDAALALIGVVRQFGPRATPVRVLNGVDFQIHPSEVVALVGPSGSGKTTLLQIAGLLAQPDAGEVWIGGERCDAMNDAARTLKRREAIGFVYQSHHLLPELSAEENVAMPQWIAGNDRHAALDEARHLLSQVGLAQRAHHRPGELSGGEQQRVAIARSLSMKPRLILADEPTGNLDPDTGEQVFSMLRASLAENGAAALIVTHNLEVAAKCDRILAMQHGKVEAHVT